MEKHKFASISLTVQDRAISSKFSIHRVSQQSTLTNFASFRTKLMLPLWWTLRMPVRPISSYLTILRVKKYNFIALIHPIQWTIALPVGATGPAKRQKKTSCI